MALGQSSTKGIRSLEVESDLAAGDVSLQLNEAARAHLRRLAI